MFRTPYVTSFVRPGVLGGSALSTRYGEKINLYFVEAFTALPGAGDHGLDTPLLVGQAWHGVSLCLSLQGCYA